MFGRLTQMSGIGPQFANPFGLLQISENLTQQHENDQSASMGLNPAEKHVGPSFPGWGGGKVCVLLSPYAQ
jgi:hypothetical protein